MSKITQETFSFIRQATMADIRFNYLKNKKMKEGIQVDKKRDLIIIEKSDGNTILKSSRLYCGCCGGVLGEAKHKIKMPCSIEEFIGGVKNKAFTSSVIGFQHISCANTMFAFKKGYNFIKLETYINNVSEYKKRQKGIWKLV